MKEIELDATDENLSVATQFVNEELEKIGCSMKHQMQIEVAVEEIFVNVAHYAYNPNVGKVKMIVEVDNNPVTVAISFIDNGKPYNPLAKEDPDVTLSAEERQIGGLGIYMVKKSMDDVIYEYQDGKNILTLKKNI